jgi:hypothetical protein
LKKTIGIVLLFFSLIPLGFGQDTLLYQPHNFSFHNLAVDSALRSIEEKTQLHFTFNSNLLASQSRVSADFNQIPLCLILDSLFRDPTLNYQIIGSQLVVYKQNAIIDSLGESDLERNASPGLTIGGEIRDAETDVSMPYANISIENSVIGSVSNEDGQFSLYIRNPNPKDTILISYLAYETLKIPINKISKYSIYKLQPKSIPLQEVIIRAVKAESIIRMAIAKEKQNYPDHAFVQRAFYREALQRDKTYLVYSEGLLDVLKRSYRPSLFKEQVRLVKQRTYKSIVARDTVSFRLYGGVKTSLDLDVVKQHFSFINPEEVPIYSYAFRDIVLNEERPTYKIEFIPRDEKQAFAFSGFIYVDIQTLAFVKFEFSYTKIALKKMRNAFTLRRSARLRILPQKAQYIVSYKSYEQKYYINHIQGNLNFKVKRKGKFLSSKYTASFEMIATELIGKAPRRFSNKQSMKLNSIFSDISPNYDVSFWREENFLLPEMDLMKAFERLKVEQ